MGSRPRSPGRLSEDTVEALDVVGGIAAVIGLACAVSWWRAGRRGLAAHSDDGRTLDPRITKGEAEQHSRPNGYTGASSYLGG